MIAHVRKALVLALTGVAIAPAACQRVPLLAPAGSTITLTTTTTALPISGTVDIIAQLIEPSGTPPQHGTHVSFTTTLGSIQPSEAETDINGRVTVRFLAGTANGTATITAISGGASTGVNGSLKIAIGTAAVGKVIVSATPATVPATGGNSTIAASVLDVNGNLLPSAPVSFSTTAGTLTAAVVATDGNGVAATTLNTSQQATVTASVGAQPSSGGGGTGGGTPPSPSGQASGTVVVNVSAAPTLIITTPTTPPSAGLPAPFTFVVTVAGTNGSAIRDLTVNWGDGQSQDLGAVTGSQTVNHVYVTAGNYLVRATVSDAAGNVVIVSTNVTVIPVPRPTIIISFSALSFIHPATVNFTIQITAPAGIGIQDVTINFDDGNIQDIGGASGALPPISHTYQNAGIYTVRVIVTDSTGQVTTGTTVVAIS